jgi:hypothetical protein
MCKWTVTLLLLSFLILPRVTEAQDITNDFGVWTSVSYGKDISKKFDFSIEQEFRLQNNATQLERTFTDVGIDYKVEKWLQFGVDYRFILDRRPSGDYGVRNRITTDAILKKQLHRFRLAYRARLQWELKGYNYNREYGFAPTWDFRNRFKASYQLNRIWEPFVALDVRLLITDANKPYITNAIDRFRLFVGTEYNMSSDFTLEFFFLTSQQVQIVAPIRVFAIGVGINFGSKTNLLGS